MTNDYCQPGYCQVPGHPPEHDDRVARKHDRPLRDRTPSGPCPECGSPLRWNKYGARWDCSNYGACENAGG